MTSVAQALEEAGFLAPGAEAEALTEAALEGAGSLDQLLARRLKGEPLAWITGWVRFCGLQIRVHPGVFVPRPHTEVLAMRAADLLPPTGAAVDLCTGSGAVAAVLRSARPKATIYATEIDPVAAACAEANGVSVVKGDLDDALPDEIYGTIDIVTAVVPYVPTEEFHLLPTDVLTYEPRRAIDGGPRGTTFLIRAAEAAARLLRDSGTLLLELGGDQARELESDLDGFGLKITRVHRDEDGDDRILEATRK